VLGANAPFSGRLLLVPTLCVVTHTETLQRFETLERLPMHSHWSQSAPASSDTCTSMCFATWEREKSLYNAAFIATPNCVGESTTSAPADFNAATLPSAVPLPPVIIAPACPILFPAGAVLPAI